MSKQSRRNRKGYVFRLQRKTVQTKEQHPYVSTTYNEMRWLDENWNTWPITISIQKLIEFPEEFLRLSWSPFATWKINGDNKLERSKNVEQFKHSVYDWFFQYARSFPCPFLSNGGCKFSVWQTFSLSSKKMSVLNRVGRGSITRGSWVHGSWVVGSWLVGRGFIARESWVLSSWVVGP